MSVLTNTMWNPGAEHATLGLEADLAATLARTNTAEGTMPKRGSYFYTMTSTATSIARARVLDEHRGAAAVGERWWVRMKLRAKASNAAARNVRVGVRFYNAAPGPTTGSAVGSDTFSSPVSLAPGAETEIWISAVAGATTLSVTGLLERQATGAVGDVIQIDDIAVIQYDDAVNPPAFVDGSLGVGYYWDNGTADLSPSSYYVPEVELEELTSPSPGVRVTITDLYPDTEAVTLYRVGDRTNTVREALNLAAQGGFSVADYEAGFQIALTYRAMQYDADGAELGYTPEAQITLDVAEDWISDPLRPGNAIVVEFTDNAGQRPQRPIPGSRHRVYTASGLRIVALVGDQGLIQDLNMDFFTSTDADYERMLEIINEANGLLLLRTPPPMMVPRSMFVVAWSPTPDEFNRPAGLGDVEWFNTVDETSQPDVGYGDPLITWQTYIDAYPTWADMQADYLTWLDAIRNPPE
jgi:hypothetical protein